MPALTPLRHVEAEVFDLVRNDTISLPYSLFQLGYERIGFQYHEAAEFTRSTSSPLARSWLKRLSGPTR